MASCRIARIGEASAGTAGSAGRGRDRMYVWAWLGSGMAGRRVLGKAETAGRGRSGSVVVVAQRVEGAAPARHGRRGEARLRAIRRDEVWCGRAGVAEQVTASLGGEAGHGVAGPGRSGERGQASLVAARVGMNGTGQARQDCMAGLGVSRAARSVRAGRIEARQERSGLSATHGEGWARDESMARRGIARRVCDGAGRQVRSGRQAWSRCGVGWLVGVRQGYALLVVAWPGPAGLAGLGAVERAIARGGLSRRGRNGAAGIGGDRLGRTAARGRGLRRLDRSRRGRSGQAWQVRAWLRWPGRGVARSGRNGPALMAGLGSFGGVGRGWPGSDGLAALGKARQEWQGLAPWGGVWWARLAPAAVGAGRQVRPGIVGRSWPVSHGKERQERSAERCDGARVACSVMAWLDARWCGRIGVVLDGPSPARDRTSGHGSASAARRVMARVGKAGLARQERQRHRSDGSRWMAVVGMAVRGRIGRAWLPGAGCLGADRTDRAACLGAAGAAVLGAVGHRGRRAACAGSVRRSVAGMARRGSHGCPGAARQEWLGAARHHPSRLASAARGRLVGQGAFLRPGLGVSGHGW